MSETLVQLFGILSILIIIPADIPYLIDVKRGNTKPHKMAQVIFMLIAAISFAAQVVEGATASAYLTLSFVIIPIILLYMSRHNKIGSIKKSDFFALILSVAVLAVWYFTKSAALAVVLITIVNTVGKVLVGIKVYQHPNSELLLTWNLSVLASVFSALAVGELNWVLLLPPIHNGITVGIIAAMIGLRRTKNSR